MADRLGAEEVRRALAEDVGDGDMTTALLGAAARVPARGRFVVEDACTVAGGPVAREVFAQLDPATKLEQHVAEGAIAAAGDVVAEVRGRADVVLAGERVALNFLQRLSGVATLTRRAVEAVRGTPAEITDTRKTTPGLRALERYAVRVGGGTNHRFSLADRVLWKDNHWVMLARSGRTLAEVLRAGRGGNAAVVEVESDAQLDEALAAGVSRILVDNQPPERVAAWVARCGPGVAVEASGGITPERAGAYAHAGARYVSMGTLTHSVRAAAITMELVLDD